MSTTKTIEKIEEKLKASIDEIPGYMKGKHLTAMTDISFEILEVLKIQQSQIKSIKGGQHG